MGADRRKLARLVVVVAVGVGFLYLSATNTTNGDSYLSFPAAVSVVHDRDLYLDEFEGPVLDGAYGAEDARGHTVDFYPWAVALVAVPSVVALDLAHAAGIGPGAEGAVRDQQMTYVQLANGTFATVAAVLVVLLVAYALTTGTAAHRRRVATWVALGFALGTSAWSVTSRSLWQHGPSMVLTGLAVLAAVQLDRGRLARGWPVLLGVGLAGGYAMRPTDLVLVVPLGAWVLWRHLRRAPWVALGAGAVLGPWVLVNRAVWGTNRPPYHQAGRAQLHDQLLEAMASNLVGPARGLLLFSPVVVVAVVGWWMAMRRRTSTNLQPPLALALAVAAAAQVVAASSLPGNWMGGYTYGPRLMADALPWLAALSVPAVVALVPGPAGEERQARRGWAIASVVALLFSVVVHAQGAYLRTSLCWNLRYERIEGAWAWDDPQLVAGLRSIGDAPLGSLFTEPCDRLG